VTVLSPFVIVVPDINRQVPVMGIVVVAVLVSVVADVHDSSRAKGNMTGKSVCFI